MNPSKIGNQKYKVRFWRPTFSNGRQKLTEAPRNLYFLKKYRDGHILKTRQSQDPPNKCYLEHFDKLARGVDSPPPPVGNRVKKEPQSY